MKKILLLIVSLLNILSFTSCKNNNNNTQDVTTDKYASVKAFIEEYNKAHPDGYITNEKWCEISSITISYSDEDQNPCIAKTNGYMKFKFNTNCEFSGSSDCFYIKRQRNNIRINYRMGEFPDELCLENIMCLNNGKYIEQNTDAYSNITISGTNNVAPLDICFYSTMYYLYQTDIFNLSTMVEHLESDWPNLSTFCGLQYISCDNKIIRISVYKNGMATPEKEIESYEYYFDDNYDLEKVIFTSTNFTNERDSYYSKRHSYMVLKFSDELNKEVKDKFDALMLDDYTEEIDPNKLKKTIRL